MSGKDQTRPKIRPILLSGGISPRLWPISRAMSPRHFQHFELERSPFQETANRVTGGPFLDPLIACHEEHRFLVASQLDEIEVKPATIILEPVILGTAPAMICAALWMTSQTDPGLMLILPCGHTIEDIESFRQAIVNAVSAANDGYLVAFGAEAKFPTPEFGYIKPGTSNKKWDDFVRHIEHFQEKPNLRYATQLVADGYWWNTGMYLMHPEALISEIEKIEPSLITACKSAYDLSQKDLDFLRLDRASLSAAQPISFSNLMMETTNLGAVTSMDSGWFNTHSWHAFYNNNQQNAESNVILGDVIAHKCANTLAYSSGLLTAVIGLKNTTVIATEDAILVSSMDNSDHSKVLLDKIEASGSDKHVYHALKFRPWGNIRTLLEGTGFVVNEVTISPGASISKRRHEFRTQHWVVVEGTAMIEKNSETMLLLENESTQVPSGDIYQLSNPGRIPLRMVEVQSGNRLDDTDIFREETNNTMTNAREESGKHA